MHPVFAYAITHQYPRLSRRGEEGRKEGRQARRQEGRDHPRRNGKGGGEEIDRKRTRVARGYSRRSTMMEKGVEEIASLADDCA